MKSSKNIHFVLILQRLHTGGAERQASYLAAYLQNKLQKKVSVFYFGKKNDDAYQWFNQHEIKCYSFGFSEKLVLGKKPTLSGRLRKYYHLLRLIVKLRKARPVVLMPFTTFEPNIIIGTIWKWTGAKACIWNQRDAGGYFPIGPYEKRILTGCSSWIANSTAAEKYLQTFYLPGVRKIYNGVILPEMKAFHSASSVIKVVMVANIHSNKDHITLLKAWNILNNQLNCRNAHLYLAGYKGDTYIEITDYITSNKLQNTITFLGVVKEVTSFLISCNIAVFSSKKEGLPNGILECMAVGLPVVATDIDGSRDALGSEYPYLSPVEDAITMADHLFTMIKSHQLRSEIGRRNRERIKNMFSVEEMANAFYKEAEKCCS